MLICLLLLEICLRAFSPQVLYDECYEPNHPDGPGLQVALDKEVGWSNVPKYTGCQYDPDTHAKVTVTHNTHGMRVTHDIRAKEKKRVLLLGDSFAYGIFVDDSMTPTAQLQEELGDGYEVLNFGTIGYGVDQSLLLLRLRTQQYEPDVVVLLLYQNDYSNDVNDIQNYARKPRFKLSTDGNLTLLNFPVKEEWSETISHSMPLAASHPFKAWLLSWSHAYSLWHHTHIIADTPTPLNETDSTITSVIRPYDIQMNYAMSLTFRLIEEADAITERRGARFIVVNIPSRLNVDLSQQALLLRTYPEIEDTDFTFPSRIFRQEMDARGIESIDLTSIASSDPDAFFFSHDGHWSPKGIAIATSLLANRIRSPSE